MGSFREDDERLANLVRASFAEMSDAKLAAFLRNSSEAAVSEWIIAVSEATARLLTQRGKG